MTLATAFVPVAWTVVPVDCGGVARRSGEAAASGPTESGGALDARPGMLLLPWAMMLGECYVALGAAHVLVRRGEAFWRADRLRY